MIQEVASRTRETQFFPEFHHLCVTQLLGNHLWEASWGKPPISSDKCCPPRGGHDRYGLWDLRWSFILGGSQSQRLCLGDVPKHTLESQVHSKWWHKEEEESKQESQVHSKWWHKEEEESKQRPRTSLSAKVLLGKVLADLTLIGHTLDTLTAPHTFQPLLSHYSE